MKSPLSAYTYLPFAYLLAVSSAYGSAYHGKYEWAAPPYVLLTFTLANLFVARHYNNSALVREPLHAHAWGAVTSAFFGVLLIDAHGTVFSAVHARTMSDALAFTYLLSAWLCSYVLERDDALLCLHLAFLYLPLRREWEMHLYLFVLYVAAEAFLHRARLAAHVDRPERSPPGSCGALRPVLQAFAYLRVPGLWALLGVPQLVFEYLRMRHKDVIAFRRVHEMISAEIELVQQQRAAEV
ncbi:Hypothetical Protein FCC1311_048472 [Hondaea fermentalgiana]|uniref:Uncharacterized protein n=1 Tax=Hondaea fermentalgiana TaxID=2315210 RepID=A0A2R5GCB6_9STRA|nr:Hypothetical Protein FCC1311_048472 [Hondaea fermentalgiana]|eukprot:GBG28626.1 Hypothetical Protein FCC1311_048472 [Hondaea fermentalgiana]